ncbi:MAG TPA: ribosome biogenesis/translation initiation ATPase RLI [Candidatus Nanoarchaeia archaeon]|nr:ribosome biogenesis/translation initiation ATPase RLI [Candidatus Nanoarchaeia archaeon]
MPRIAVVEEDKCHPDKCGNYLCIRLCPVNRTGTECIVQGADKKAEIFADLCTGCGICPNRCPFGAISIINLPDELAETPIHQYGHNGFHLYNLPTPVFGKVVGIIGKNGIGKSTAIKILAGVLAPNLGTGRIMPLAELLKFFKGSETQLFFERLSRGEITVAYKPQQVDLIPKTAQGKVIDLLERVNETGKLQEIAELLDITEILSHDITHISGGELQRVAIAATVLRKANLYIFDEPTSYLDIRQRIKVAQFIKSLAGPETAVLVAEHDLIILDYMTDLVHIAYGKENVYGIISQLKSTRAGINVYLSGYLKEENMRFRSHPIQFFTRPPSIAQKGEQLVEWDGLAKQLDSFALQAGPGTLQKGRIIGVLGENGIGKTTFVKLLAHVLQPDRGSLSRQLTVAYKPQYLTVNDGLVVDLLAAALQKYDQLIIRPLDLVSLLERPLSELSGGQLQRVAIAYALSQDCQLLLLDEPSAYLDVEQRLAVSKVIREVVEQRNLTCLIVDHDLLFIDYLAEQLLVFSGIPAKQGIAAGPFSMQEGMNVFLERLGITLRRDKETLRPKINKPESRLDQEQQKSGKRYYT